MNELVGTRLPENEFLFMGASGPDALHTKAMTEDKKIIIFAVPGAFTPTCTQTHLPGFVENADKLREKGITDIYCVTVNDVFVSSAWGEMIGASDAGVQVISDANSAFTKALGVAFDAPPAGLYGRSKRYAMIVENGIIKHFEIEAEPGQCSVSSASHLLDVLD